MRGSRDRTPETVPAEDNDAKVVKLAEIGELTPAEVAELVGLRASVPGIPKRPPKSRGPSPGPLGGHLLILPLTSWRPRRARPHAHGNRPHTKEAE